MNLWVIILIAVGLSMDTFAVSLASGSSVRKERMAHALRIGGSFAFFQMMMPILGWCVARVFKSYIETFDHWVAFGLLVLIGLKMIAESFDADCGREKPTLTARRLLLLSVATSIDALAVGVSFAFLDYPLLFCVGVIGAVTFLVSFAGVILGHWCCCKVGRQAECVGGLILIVLGIRILLEHLRV